MSKKRDPKWLCPKCGGHRFVYLDDKRLRRVVLRTSKSQWVESPQIVVYWSDNDVAPPWANGRTGYACVSCKHDFGDRDSDFRNSLFHVVPPQQPAVPQQPTPPIISELQLATLDDITGELQRRDTLSYILVVVESGSKAQLSYSHKMREEVLVPMLAKIIHDRTEDKLKEFRFD